MNAVACLVLNLIFTFQNLGWFNSNLNQVEFARLFERLCCPSSIAVAKASSRYTRCAGRWDLS